MSASWSSRSRQPDRRRTVRYLAAAVSAGAALLYFGIAVGVLEVVDEVAADGPGMFEFGAISGAAFALGTILLLAFDHRALWLLGALFQVGALVMYVVVSPQRTPPFELWGILIKALQGSPPPSSTSLSGSRRGGSDRHGARRGKGPDKRLPRDPDADQRCPAMSKRELEAAGFRAAADVEAYLRSHSGLPGPRGNLELIDVASAAADRADLQRWAALTPDEAPENTPDVFVACVGIVGLGRMVAAGDRSPLAILRRSSNDPRWRVREAVAMALQARRRSRCSTSWMVASVPRRGRAAMALASRAPGERRRPSGRSPSSTA
jgi:hypothetical protein